MSLHMFLEELKETATAEALIAKNLVCQKSGMIFNAEEFRVPPSIRQVTTVMVSDTRQKTTKILSLPKRT